MTPPRWDLVEGALKSYDASRSTVGKELGPVATAMGDQTLASFRTDVLRHGLDPNDPAIVMALVFMLGRFSLLLQTWGPLVQQIDPHVACCAKSVEQALGTIVVDLVPAEARRTSA